MELFSGFLLLAFGLAHLAPLAAPFVYRAAEAKHRAEWQEFTLPKVTLDVSAYRSGGPVVPGHLERAPAFDQHVRLGEELRVEISRGLNLPANEPVKRDRTEHRCAERGP